jgi:NhaA family Na+:H+ antiporter
MQENPPQSIGADLVGRLRTSFRRLFGSDAAGGVLLLACTVVALVWTNSPERASYEALQHVELGVTFGAHGFRASLLHWINDGLMAMFFFVVGLEIKREVLAGELASFRKAALPVAAALGGMIVPAVIYAAFNAGGAGAAGWGIPMATDIAFAVGVMALLGKRVPTGLKVFLTALAIADDLGAVVVIAVFYTSHISWANLAVGAGFLSVMIVANRLGVRRPLVYAVFGIGGVWTAFLMSGVHATIAGVLAAMVIPARTRIETGQFLERGRGLLEEFEAAAPHDEGRRQEAIEALETAAEHVQTPLQRLEHALHPWVMYFVMPVFALANAGVALSGGLEIAIADPTALGVVVGLAVGKPAGITLFSLAAVRMGAAALPTGVSRRQLFGAGCLAGIGFTMSLFIAALAFGEGERLAVAKIGIMAASLISGVVGTVVLLWPVRSPKQDDNRAGNP